MYIIAVSSFDDTHTVYMNIHIDQGRAATAPDRHFNILGVPAVNSLKLLNQFSMISKTNVG